MTAWLLAAAWALWLGIFTSINPCPLATNVAAISYIGRRVDSPWKVCLAGMLYALGRTLAYVVLGALLVASVLAIEPVSDFLLTHMKKLLGPLLIVVAVFLLELLQFDFGGKGVSEKLQRRVDAWGIWGALPLGVVFALTFCPLSAGLFFGVLVPFAIQADSAVVLPSLYGIGTALPVLVFAVLIALSAEAVGKAFNVLSKIEWWARRITGVVFLAVGIHYSLKYVFEIIPFWDPWLQAGIAAVPFWKP